MKNKRHMGDIGLFVLRISYSHVIAYFVAGIFAVLVLGYQEHFLSEPLSFMRPVDSAIVALGPSLQIFRGLFLSLILIPLRETFTKEKNGFIKLGILILGLSLFFTIGPTVGSFDGYIFTNIPFMYQILGYPEAFLYILLFISILWLSYKKQKKWLDIIGIFAVAVICSLSIMGYLFAI
ncbi:hypothetical protein KQY27_00600 [Methanobrevibacter sp. TMH8]|uniref:hypothetical protein n=1 Tax=Methanobrevibacter sp. TMH8 TaxID=2848611 RepID=UPI001CD038BD|nr:hypothetical protein [Methanobrevibacter sp. TMH8]MBZ9570053.1 hypothetical protein [Methanobrevibacter sp. TMH8]